MSAFLRFLAGCFLLVAVIAAVDDLTRSRAQDRTVVTSAAEHWSRIAPSSFNGARSTVERRTHPWVWTYGIREVLRLPTWVLLGVVGLTLGYVGRRRRRVNVFAN